MNKQLIHKILIAIGVLIIALVIFQAGVFVGFKKAGFSDRLEFFHDMVPGGHGVAGKVIKITLPSLVIEGSDNIEKTIQTDQGTMVRHGRDSLSPKDIQIDDMVVILGAPDRNGKVDAKLIRIITPNNQPK